MSNMPPNLSIDSSFSEPHITFNDDVALWRAWVPPTSTDHFVPRLANMPDNNTPVQLLAECVNQDAEIRKPYGESFHQTATEAAAHLELVLRDLNTVSVVIPGIVTAHYFEGVITGINFTPHASGAGYFGPAAIPDDDDVDLDVENTDGPFWRAVQHALSDTASMADTVPLIGWVE